MYGYRIFYLSLYFLAFCFFLIYCNSSSSSILNTSIPTSGGLVMSLTSSINNDATSIFLCVPIFFDCVCDGKIITLDVVHIEL